MFRDRVRDDIFRAGEILIKLDNALARSYTGKRSAKHDRAIQRVRKSVRKALDAMHSKNWIGAIKDIA